MLGRERLRVTVHRPASRLEFRRELPRIRALKADAAPVGMDRVPAVTVINLASRTERLSSFMREMDRLGIDHVRRFDAISDPNGALGCARSHARVIQDTIDRSLPYAMICEDDVRFLLSRDRLDVLVEAFLNDHRAEIACLEFKAQKTRRHNRLFLRATDTHNAGCYIIKASIAKDLLAVVDDGITAMERGGDRLLHNIDIAWKKLQPSRFFLVPIERVAHQGAGYSDIERDYVRR